MIRPLNVLTAACLCMVSLQTFAQIAEPLILNDNKNSRVACAGAGMNAGNILNITSLGTQSNDIGADPIVLCFGDQILINHAGDAVLIDDPELSTAAGIGYAYYTCPPTTMGEDIAALTTDACLTDMPAAAEGVWVARGNAEGDVVFNNNGNLQKQFFNGRPDIMHFAPITITNFESTPPSFDDGSCLHVNTSEAFSVLYLNQIELTNFSSPDNSSLSGMFSLTGGYPEFDNNINYIVSLTKVDDPTVTGTIDALISHGGTTTFSVPERGTYNLTVTDPKGCSREFVVHVPSVDPVQLCMVDTSVMAEENFCIPVTVADFKNVLSIAFTIGWDPSVIEFTSVTNVNSIFGSFITFVEDRKDEGIVPVLYFENNLNLIALPDSTIIFEICFTAVGPPGSRTDIKFINSPTGISITDDAMDLATILKPGSVVITNPDRPTVYYNACANASGNADLSLQVFGGDEPYNYQILVSSTMAVYDAGSLFAGSGNFSNVPPDMYEVIITDATGFPVTVPIDLNLTPLQIDTLVTDPTCMGADNGSIEITSITGGSNPYSTTWTGPGLLRYGTFLLSDLQAGIYELIAEDANGCADTLSVELVDGGLSISIGTVPPVCSGETGEITVSVDGAGSEDYQWTWSNSDGSLGRTITAPSPLVLPNLETDTYFITLSNGQCEVERSATLLPMKTLSIDIDPSTQLTTTCFGDRDGRIDIYASADRNQSAFTFTWDNVTQDSGIVTIDAANNHSFVTDLPAGTYSVRIVDAQGCEISQSFTIAEPQPLNVNPRDLQRFITQPDCPDGANGEIDLGFAETVIGGTGFPPPRSTYIFRWYDVTDGANTLINDRSSRVRDLTAGMYGIYIEDANGCSDSTVLELVSGPTIDIVLDQENVCRGDSVAQLTVFGDLTGNDLVWSTGATTPTISNLKEGVYYVSVTENSNMGVCNVVDSFVIIDPVVQVRTILPMQFGPRSLCNEPDSGIIFNLQIDYPGPKDYIWHSLNDTLTNAPFISIDQSGSYPFTVIDRLTGCIIYDSVVNAQFPEQISLTIDTSHVSCNGDQDGVITVMATGRGGQFDFVWATGFSVSNASQSSASNLAPGVYQLTVTESTDPTCQVPLTLTIVEPELLTLTVDSAFTQNIRCFGEDNGQIGLIWEGGNSDAAPSIVWSAGGVSNTLSATDLPAGDYNIALTDSKGCTDAVDVTITEPPQLFATVPAPAEPVCNGFQTSVTVTTASGGTGTNYTFSVDNGPPQPLGAPYLSFAGEYTVSVFDEQGCRIDTSITINEPQAIEVDLGPDIKVALGDSARLNPLVIGPSTIDSYIWSPDSLLSCNNCDNPLVNPIQDQVFELTVVDVNGCEGQDQILINVNKARLVYLPNVFTPNGDGINDTWDIFSGPGVKDIKAIRIFDRWGNLMMENDNPDDPNVDGSLGWTGRISGSLVHPGVYVYLVDIEFIDGRIFTYRGDVTLLP